jgi:hydroxymethylbilane synthase
LNSNETIVIATRGSALALAQANAVLDQCRAAFPGRPFEIKIVKTTGDKLQTAALAQEGANLPKGLFTKELEIALLEKHADLAVHSLKDLPTEVPAGLALGAVGKRADVRDVLIYRDETRLGAGTPGDAPVRRGFPAALTIADLPEGAVVATSSTRRKAQLLVQNPGLQVPDIRGNVATRLQKLADRAELDATVLALAGMRRLHFQVGDGEPVAGEGVPEGLLARILDTDVMLPCVGQGAVGIEIRAGDGRMAEICAALNDFTTQQCVTAERAFLAAMGGGCQSPVAAHAEADGRELRMRALSFTDGPVRRAQGSRPIHEAAELGRQLASELKGAPCS